MKALVAITMLCLAPAAAAAHPGGHQLSCKSVKGGAHAVTLALSRSNGRGWAAPSFTMTIDGKDHEFTGDDEMLTYGETDHDAPLGLIRVVADNSEDPKATAHGGFTVLAIPRTVKAYDRDGHLRKWRIEDEDDDNCYDANGKATFRAMFRGWLDDGKNRTSFGAQILQCTLEYDSGMAC